MHSPKSLSKGRKWARNWTASWPVVLLAAWTVAWFVELRLRDRFAWDTEADTIYWITMRIALWVVPVIVILRRERLAVLEFVQLTKPLRGIGIGLLAGLGLIAFSFAMDAVLGGASFNLPVLDPALLNGVLVAPLVEEFAVRGFYLGWLERGLTQSSPQSTHQPTHQSTTTPFMTANVRAGLVFVALHVPGWYFQGRLRAPLSLIQPAVFLWLLALLLGWFKKTARSLYAPMVVHILNNFYTSARG